MNTALLRRSVIAAGATFVLSVFAGAFSAPAVQADNTPNSIRAVMPSHNLQIPSSAPSTHPGNLHIGNWSPDFYWFYDYSRHQWCILRVDFVKYNPYTHARLVKVTLFCYDYHHHCWYASYGSGSEQDGNLTFTMNRQNDGLGDLYFEGKAYHWGTYHQVGNPHHTAWFLLKPF